MGYVQYSFWETSRWENMQIVRQAMQEDLQEELEAIKSDDSNKDLIVTGPAIEEENGGLSYFLVSSAWLANIFKSSDDHYNGRQSEIEAGQIINEPIARKIYEQRQNASGIKNHYFAHDNAVELNEPEEV